MGEIRFSTTFMIALRFLLSRKRSMLMSLAGIIFGIGFFVITQAQTSGFQSFFIRTMLGVNGMVRIQDRLQSTMRSIAAEKDSSFAISLEEGKKYISGIKHPEEMMDAILRFDEVTGANSSPAPARAADLPLGDLVTGSRTQLCLSGPGRVSSRGRCACTELPRGSPTPRGPTRLALFDRSPHGLAPRVVFRAERRHRAAASPPAPGAAPGAAVPGTPGCGAPPRAR